MGSSKINIIMDYDNLEKELKTKLKFDHPNGLGSAIIEFINNKKKKVSAIRWETSDKIFMLRISNKMLIQIMENEFELNESVQY